MTKPSHPVQGSAWMMPLRVVSAFTNIAGPYFALIPQIVLKPRTIGRAVALQEPILPAHDYLAYGFGLLFFAYYVSAQVRGGDTTTLTQSLLDYALTFTGAFTFAGAIRFRSNVAISFADVAAIYIYAFSTFSIAALVANEFVGLVLAAPSLGHTVTGCPSRSLDCLVHASGQDSGAASWAMWLQLVFGLAGVAYVVIMLRGAASVAWWRIGLGIAATFAVNAAVDQILIDPVIDCLKALGWWR